MWTDLWAFEHCCHFAVNTWFVNEKKTTVIIFLVSFLPRNIVNTFDIVTEVKNKENKVPPNSGQIAKEFLCHHESTGFNYTYKGKGEVKEPRVRRTLKRVYDTISGPSDMPSKHVKLCLEKKFKKVK